MKKTMKSKRRGPRRQHGFIIVLASWLGFLLLLPLGLYAFEVARIYLCQAQLRAVTDAAALAGATYMSAPSSARLSPAEALDKAKKQALLYVRRNVAAACDLSLASISKTVDSDIPAKGEATYDLLYDSEKKLVTAKAVLGVEPLFGRFLGINPVPVHAQSSAAVSGLDGDLVILFDLSRSMGFATKSVWIDRKWDPSQKKMSYSIKKKLNTANATQETLPGFPNIRYDVVPDPEIADFSRSEKLKALANASIQTKLAALVEAKAGNLENSQIFESSHAKDTELSSLIGPQAGLQDEYQKLALAATQPLADAKSALNDFIAKISESKNVHMALVTFSSDVSRSDMQSRDRADSYSTRFGFHLPNVELSKSSSKNSDVVDAIGPTPVFEETNTALALKAATAMLKGNGHRKNVAKTILLLTDGRPNPPGGNYFSGLQEAENAAKDAGSNGIRIYAVGFFHTSYSDDELKNGPRALNSIVAAAGNGSRSYVAPDVPNLKNVLHGIATNGVALVNN